MTDTMEKREAQNRVDRIHAFRQQLAELEHECVLELADEQRARINSHLDRKLLELAERYNVDISESQKRISLGMRILSTLGGLAFCAALFLFFHRYWGNFSTLMQVLILAGTPTAGLVALRYVARRDRTSYYTALLGMVVFASFILDLNGISSVFNMAPSQACFLAWGTLAMILAYTCRLRLLLAAGLLCWAVCLAATITSWGGGYWLSFLDRPEGILPAGLAAIAVPFLFEHRKAADFPGIYRLAGLLGIFIPLEMLYHDGSASYLPLPSHAVEAIYRIVGFLAAGAAIWLGIRGGRTGVVNVGSAFFALYIFDQLHSWWWNWMPHYLFCLVIGLIALALLAVFQKLRTRTRENRS